MVRGVAAIEGDGLVRIAEDELSDPYAPALDLYRRLADGPALVIEIDIGRAHFSMEKKRIPGAPLKTAYHEYFSLIGEGGLVVVGKAKPDGIVMGIGLEPVALGQDRGDAELGGVDFSEQFAAGISDAERKSLEVFVQEGYAGRGQQTGHSAVLVEA